MDKYAPTMLIIGIVVFVAAFIGTTVLAKLPIASKQKSIACVITLVIIVLSVIVIIWSATAFANAPEKYPNEILISGISRLATPEAIRQP